MVTDALAVRRGAARFYWGQLIVASAVSVAANVGDAFFIIQTSGSGLTAAAAALAVVPPLFQIGATHSISWLVRSRASGAAYRAALAGTVVLAVFAFLLSFVAIRSLATFLGFNQHILGIPVAAIFPLVIDVSISCATVCLLSLPAPDTDVAVRADVVAGPASVANKPSRAVRTESRREEYRTSHVTAHRVSRPTPAPSAATVQDPPTAAITGVRRDSGHGRALSAVGPMRSGGGGAEVEPADDDELLVIATRIVESKITTKSPELVADLLADHVAGMGPTAIAKKNDVHHSVVRKVLDSAGRQLRAS